MKKFLMSGAALTLLLAAAPAMAADYTAANNAKNHDSTLGSATYAEPQRTSEAAPSQTQTTTTSTDTEAMVEPSAGGEDWRDNFTGFYAGADGEYTAGGANVRGWGGGAFAGYGWTPHVAWAAKPYLGAELGFDWSGASSDTLAEKRNGMVSLRPGAVFGENVLGYGILGYSRGNFKSNVTNDDGWTGGWTVGAGAELAPMQAPLRVRLEYAYTNYNDEDLGGVNVNPHSNDIKLGLVYRFR